MNQEVEELKIMFEIRCQQRELAWRVDADLSAGNVSGDENKLRQVLINLLGNAVKFSERGSVELRVEQRGEGRFYFAVSDTGVGIAPELRQVIFQPFQQGEGGGIGAWVGTGLGLTISQHFVAMMGGQLELESELGQGTRFFFFLTAAADNRRGGRRISECALYTGATVGPGTPGASPGRR